MLFSVFRVLDVFPEIISNESMIQVGYIHFVFYISMVFWKFTLGGAGAYIIPLTHLCALAFKANLIFLYWFRIRPKSEKQGNFFVKMLIKWTPALKNLEIPWSNYTLSQKLRFTLGNDPFCSKILISIGHITHAFKNYYSPWPNDPLSQKLRYTLVK